MSIKPQNLRNKKVICSLYIHTKETLITFVMIN